MSLLNMSSEDYFRRLGTTVSYIISPKSYTIRTIK